MYFVEKRTVYAFHIIIYYIYQLHYAMRCLKMTWQNKIQHIKSIKNQKDEIIMIIHQCFNKKQVLPTPLKDEHN